MTDTVQMLFDLVLATAGFLAIWVLKGMQKSIDRLDNDLRKIPKEYVSKEDHRDSLIRIEAVLNRIDGKLDNKVDKD